MKMKMPTRIALLFSIFLAVLALYFFFLDNSGSINPMVRDFSFGRVDNITEIHLTDKNQSITLIKEKTGWFADGKYRVKNQLPELFLNTINSIKVKAPASKEIRSKLQEQLINSKHIDLYKGNHKVCSYYILFDSVYTQGTYLMKKWAKVPLEAEITGIDFPIANLYHCDLTFWKAKFIFQTAPENIEWVSFENTSQPSSSFKLERMRNGKINLTDLGTQTSSEKIDPIAANDYFSSLTKVQYLKELENSDSVDFSPQMLDKAEYIVKVKTANTEPIEFKFFSYYRKGNSIQAKNADLFIGIVSQSPEVYICRYTDFDPIIRSYNYFLNK